MTNNDKNKKIVPEVKGTLRSHMIELPEVIRTPQV